MALVIALAALAIGSALWAAVFLSVMEETRAARRISLRTHARASADEAAWEAAHADPATWRALAVGGEIAAHRTAGGITTTVHVLRTDSAHVWIVASADCVSGDEIAHTRVGLSLSLAGVIAAAAPRVPSGPAWSPLY